MATTIEIFLNGDAREVPAETTVAGLLEVLELPRARVAVEVNRSLVSRDQHRIRELHAGDRVELVTLVGGG